MHPKVSIILPNYNHQEFLEERLYSIFEQTYKNWELIILDDYSTDQSLIILERYRNHPKVSHFIVNEMNTGSPFMQWQKGLQLAQGDYIWIAESDDTCELNFLETSLNYFQSDLIVTKTLGLYYKTKTTNEERHFGLNNKGKNKLDLDAYLNCPFRNVSALIFKKECIKNLNKMSFHNFKLVGDHAFYLEAFKGKICHFNNNSLSFFRRFDASVSDLNNKSLNHYLLYFKENIKLLRLLESNFPQFKMTDKEAFLNDRFNKINNRIEYRQKISITYFKLLLLYKTSLISLKK